MRIDLITPAIARRLPERERGATLLISICILTLLFVFSMAFVRLVNFERTASANYTDSVRARMLARAGIERAIVEMQRIAGRRHYSHPGMPTTKVLPADTMGDAWSYSDNDPAVDCPQPATYDPLTKQFKVAGRIFPLDIHSTRTPSFRLVDTRTFYGAPLVYSGKLGESYAGGVDIYKLKVFDTARMLDLNHPDQVAARRMLKNLLYAALNPGITQGQAAVLANAIIDRRPPSGFKSKAEIESILLNPPSGSGTGISPDTYRRKLRDLITVYAWRDEKVIRPWAQNSIAGDITADLNTTTTGAGVSLVEPAQRILTLSPARAPININTAPREVLIAMFADARAVTERFGVFGIGYTGAERIADAIIARRTGLPPYTGTSSGSPTTLGGPFRTWNEFERFVDTLNTSSASEFPRTISAGLTNESAMPVGAAPHKWRSESSANNSSFLAGGGGVAGNRKSPILKALLDDNQGCKDLIKAIANPNTMVSKFGMAPNHGGGLISFNGGNVRIPRLVDKSDITSLTTEGCFDAMGIFEVTAIGMVMIPEENPTTALRLVAAQTEQKVVKIYDVFRLTTQQDFEANRAFMVAGDFIEAKDKGWGYETAPNKASVHGLNKPAYGPAPTRPGFVGWPGLVTWPTYSLDRNDLVDTGGNPLPPGIAYAAPQGSSASGVPPTPSGASYVMAAWDGNMTLSNLIAYKMEDIDFILGFARGKLDAFKVRAWWDPRHQYHNGVYIATDPPDGVDNDGDGWVDEAAPRPASLAELTALATPMNSKNLSRTTGVLSTESQLIDEDPAAAAAVANNLFLDGSSLWNTGVAIHPFRKDPATGRAQFISYDSANLDLNRGFSLRFWVQPLADPYARPEEVLCSFVGSRGGSSGYPSYSNGGRNPPNGANARDVGFRVIKEVTAGGQVMITLDLIGSFADPASISLPVTPNAGQNNPLQPEWLPGSWHWIVVNMGPRADKPNEYDATIQVDMIQSQYGSQPEFRGTTKNPGFGEMHGMDPGDAGDYFNRGPLRSSGPSSTVVWNAVRLLGDWYNCESASASVTTTTKQQEFGPNAIVVNSAGTGYVQGPNWPANPFPPTSSDHKLWLKFTKASGDTTTTTPPGPSPPYGSMAQNPGPGGFSGWTYTIQPADMGTDGVPGGHEWNISVVAEWTETSLSGSFCACCEGTHAPDPGYPGADQRNMFALNNTQAHCNHDSTGTQKGGYGDSYPPGSGHYCLVYQKTQLTGLSGVTPPGNVHEQCDDCHGCENCDVDGPIFFGGEPTNVAGNYNNQDQGAAPQGLKASTIAYAVFDNLLFLNNKERRTDNISDPNHNFFEDRFFETAMAYIMGSTGAPNFGAQYHRGLLELVGSKARLGTVTWTAYPSTENLRFEVGIYSVPAFDAPVPSGNTTFNLANSSLLSGVPGFPAAGAPFAIDPATGPSAATDNWTDCPIGGAAHTAVVSNSVINYSEVGLNLSGQAYDGEGLPMGAPGAAPPSLLVLGVRLRDMPPPNPVGGSGGATPDGSSSITLNLPGGSTFAVTKGGNIGARAAGSSVPQPLLSTPVFEDLTMTLIPDRTTTLYAEEGVEE